MASLKEWFSESWIGEAIGWLWALDVAWWIKWISVVLGLGISFVVFSILARALLIVVLETVEWLQRFIPETAIRLAGLIIGIAWISVHPLRIAAGTFSDWFEVKVEVRKELARQRAQAKADWRAQPGLKDQFGSFAAFWASLQRDGGGMDQESEEAAMDFRAACALLGLGAEFSYAQFKAALRAMRGRTHPDKPTGDGESFIQVEQAAAVILNEKGWGQA